MLYDKTVVFILVEPASIRTGILPIAITYRTMISSRVNKDDMVLQRVTPGSVHVLIRVAENVYLRYILKGHTIATVLHFYASSVYLQRVSQ